LRDLAKEELIEFEPPFRGKEIYIKLRVPSSDLEMDWKAIERKLEKDMSKLSLMEGYVYHQGSKREYILRYFGDKSR
jgi:hypothetical protein